jgi:hypothetical protein
VICHRVECLPSAVAVPAGVCVHRVQV